MNNETYTYYYRLRPPAPGCQPKKGILKFNFNKITVDGKEYWGSVDYNRQLTEKEIYNYDLDYIE